MFNFSSESQKALIGQPWTVPWALITPAAKTGLGWGLGRGRGAGFVRDISMAWSHNILILGWGKFQFKV